MSEAALDNLLAMQTQTDTAQPVVMRDFGDDSFDIMNEMAEESTVVFDPFQVTDQIYWRLAIWMENFRLRYTYIQD